MTLFFHRSITRMSLSESTPASPSETHAADIEFFVRRGMTKGYQAMSLLTPPLYTVFILTRRGRGAWHLSRFLRASWVGGAVGMPTSVRFSCTYPSSVDTSRQGWRPGAGSSTSELRIATKRRLGIAGSGRVTTCVWFIPVFLFLCKSDWTLADGFHPCR